MDWFQTGLLTQAVYFCYLSCIQFKEIQVVFHDFLLCGVYQPVYWFKYQYQIAVLIFAALVPGFFMVAMNFLRCLKGIPGNCTFPILGGKQRDSIVSKLCAFAVCWFPHHFPHQIFVLYPEIVMYLPAPVSCIAAYAAFLSHRLFVPYISDRVDWLP